MLQRLAQIGGRHFRHEGKDRLDLAERHLDRHDGRGARFVERLGHVFNLGKGGMRLEDVEDAEPLFPIVEAAQDGEGGCRSDGIHAVRGIDRLPLRRLRH